MTGLIGSKLPKFSIFGDTMNTASRMESTCVPGNIQISDSTWALVKGHDAWKPTGGIEVKGKGIMETYLWDGDLPELLLDFTKMLGADCSEGVSYVPMMAEESQQGVHLCPSGVPIGETIAVINRGVMHLGILPDRMPTAPGQDTSMPPPPCAAPASEPTLFTMNHAGLPSVAEDSSGPIKWNEAHGGDIASPANNASAVLEKLLGFESVAEGLGSSSGTTRSEAQVAATPPLPTTPPSIVRRPAPNVPSRSQHATGDMSTPQVPTLAALSRAQESNTSLASAPNDVWGMAANIALATSSRGGGRDSSQLAGSLRGLGGGVAELMMGSLVGGSNYQLGGRGSSRGGSITSTSRRLGDSGDNALQQMFLGSAISSKEPPPPSSSRHERALQQVIRQNSLGNVDVRGASCSLANRVGKISGLSPGNKAARANSGSVPGSAWRHWDPGNGESCMGGGGGGSGVSTSRLSVAGLNAAAAASPNTSNTLPRGGQMQRTWSSSLLSRQSSMLQRRLGEANASGCGDGSGGEGNSRPVDRMFSHSSNSSGTPSIRRDRPAMVMASMTSSWSTLSSIANSALAAAAAAAQAQSQASSSKISSRQFPPGLFFGEKTRSVGEEPGRPL